MEELERVYVVPLADAYEKPRAKRAKIAVKILRSFISRHMKVGEESVNISGPVNDEIWTSGMKKPPRRIKVTVKRDKEGHVSVELVGEKEAQAKASEKAKQKEEKRKKAASEKKEKPKEEAKAPEAPAEKKPEEKKSANPKKKKKEG